MTDKRIRMGCPFCGCDKNEIQVKTMKVSSKDGNKYVIVFCPKCGAEFHGFGVQNIINKWNCRY